MLTPDQIERMAREHGVDVTRLSTVVSFACAVERAAREAAIEECCAAIKAEDDRMADEDYMLDSDDCIAAIRALREGS
jgi:hypothetical protein